MTDANAVIDTVAEEFIPVDTTVVQVRSILNFMYALGYVLDGTVKTARFFTEAADGQANRYLSVNTAIRLHNMPAHGWELVEVKGDLVAKPKGVNLKAGYTPIGVRLAIASKLVDKAKISVNRTGQIVTQDVMIKPLNVAVLQLVEG